MTISEMIKALEYELKGGNREIIIDIDISLKHFKDVYVDKTLVQLPSKATIFFNSDGENLHIQNFPY